MSNTKQINKKNKIIAVLLNILFLGSGYLYVGNIKKALLFCFAIPILIYLAIFVSIYYVNVYIVFLYYIFIILIYIYSIYDVVKNISNQENKYNIFTKWYFIVIFIVLYIAYHMVLKTYIPLQIYYQTSSSMESTIQKGDRIIVYKNGHQPKRGDVVVFRYPKNIKVYYIKRCVALGGDEILFQEKKLYIHFREGDKWIKKHYPKNRVYKIFGKLWVLNPYMLKFPGIHYDKNVDLFKEMLPYLSAGQLAMKPMMVDELPKVSNLIFNAYYYKVPRGRFFIMGDNRDHSNDSRFFGSIPLKLIEGQAISIFINFKNLNRSGLKIQ